MLDLAALVLKTVPCRFKGGDISLDLSHALFSSFDVDVGTRLLFKALGRDEALPRARRLLDAGSGVGVIGLALARALPEARVLARDRDLLARAFTERNRRRNKIGNLEAEAGLIGAGAMGGPFDFILSNVPAKAGAPVIRAFLAESRAALAPGGRLGMVIVKPLVEESRAWLAEAGFQILSEERGSMHRAFVCSLSEAAASPGAGGSGAAFEAAGEAGEARAPAEGLLGEGPGPELELGRFSLAAYRRSEAEFGLMGRRYRAAGYWGLPDFDTIGFGQKLAAELASRAASGSLVREALVVNPGIGHAALWAALALGPERISAASRDLLSLAATGENLAALARALGRGPEAEGGLAYRALDALRLDELPPASFDLHLEFAEPLPEYDWIGPLWERALALDKRGASFVLVAPTTELQRIERRRPAGFRLLWEKKKKGLSGAAFRRD